MRFDIDKVNGQTAGLGCYYRQDVSNVINGDVDVLEAILRSYSSICGEETKQRLRDAITGRVDTPSMDDGRLTSRGIDYSDTPIRGRHYVYLWFDANGELFYIGKGKYNRSNNMYSRKVGFQERAEGGYCLYVAYNMDEIYAFDLERILIWESLFSGKQLLNVDGGNGVEAIQYCKHDRDALLWYWDHMGTIGRFSELTGIRVIYNARNTKVTEAIESRLRWWGDSGPMTNDPVILESERKAEEKKRKQREYQASRRLMKKSDSRRT